MSKKIQEVRDSGWTWRRWTATGLLFLGLLCLGAYAAGASPAQVLKLADTTSTDTSSTDSTPSTDTSSTDTSSTDSTSSTDTSSTVSSSTDTSSTVSTSTVSSSTSTTTSTNETTSTNGNGGKTAGPSLGPLTTTDSPSVGAYDQCSNDQGTGYTSGDTGCRWINGNLQHNNSVYYEGDSTVQRLWITGLAPGATHSVTFTYGTTKGGKHAYDYLTTWNASENWITDADRCQDITGCDTASSESTYGIPTDPRAAGHDTGTRNFVMRGGTLTNVSTPSLASGSYSGDSETAITVSFTVGPDSGAMCSTSKGVTTCGVALWFGAHVASQLDWGTGSGAASISGSPYHVALSDIDTTAIGQRDNQMQSNTVPETGTLTITKAFDPGTSGFTGNFTIHYDCGTNFTGDETIAAGGSASVTGLPLPSTCTVSEPTLPTPPSGWTFGTPSISPAQPVTISTATPVTVTVTNSIGHDQGYLKISKVFDAKTSGFTGTFAIVYNCGAGDQTVNLHGGESSTVGPFDTGTSCAVSEPNLPTAPNGWTFGTPSISGSPATIVEGTTDTPVTVTVTNTISRDTGSLKLTKSLTGGPNDYTGPFTIHYSCNNDTSGDKSIAAGGSETISGIPTGTQCTVTEPNLPNPPDGYTFGAPSFSPNDGVVTITTKDATVEVTTTNTLTRDTGSLKISKIFDAGDSGFDGTFTIVYNCGAGDQTVELTAGGSTTVGPFDTGTSCTVSEPSLPDAPTGWTFGTPQVDGSPATIVKGTVDTPVSVTVTNTITRDTGTIELKKVWSGGTSSTTLSIGSTAGGHEVAQKTVTSNDTTGAKEVPTGTYYVSESSISGYSSSLACVNTAGETSTTVAVGANGSAPVNKGDQVVCTFTNTFVPPPPPPPPTTSSTPPPPPPPPPPAIDLAVTKVDNPDPDLLSRNLTYTMVVTNNGPDTATNVLLADPLPAFTTFVSVASAKGTCTGGSVVSCSLGTMAAGTNATITLVVKPTITGTITNTVTVVGNEAETNRANNTASATTLVTAPFTPPRVKSKPAACYALVVAPKQLTVDRLALLKLGVKAGRKPVAGTRVELRGPGILKLSRKTNRHGRVDVKLRPKKPGILRVKPAAYKGCNNPRVGIIGVFTPPVTG